ncbi:MAG: hypothetical protein ACSLEW_09160 [Nocardioides sp.]
MRLLRPVITTLATTLAVAAPIALVGINTSAQAHTTTTVRVKATVDPHWIPAGESATITGTLLAAGEPLAGQSVTLISRVPAHNGFVVAETASTGDSGKVSFTVAPTTRTIYRIKFTGADGLSKSISHRMVVHLKKPTKVDASAAVSADGIVILGKAASKAHPLPAKKVVLETSTEAGWVKLVAEMTNRKGRVAFVVTEGGDFRLVFPGSTRYLPSQSKVLTVG